jgi:hypothetical protein
MVSLRWKPDRAKCAQITRTALLPVSLWGVSEETGI